MHQDTGMQAFGSSWHPGVVWSGGNLGGERVRVGGAGGAAEGQSEAPEDVRRVKRSDCRLQTEVCSGSREGEPWGHRPRMGYNEWHVR